MAINPEAAGAEGTAGESSWDSKDSLLYALGVGAGASDPTGFELDFTTENTKGVDQKALPTMAVVLGGGGSSPLSELGDVNYGMMVHGEQQITLHKPLPVAGSISSVARIDGIYDKGKAALVVLETVATDTSDGEAIFTNRSSLFFRGEGGWGGDSGPKNTVTIPDSDADAVVSYQTRSDQALLYRLNGDRNPLHSDPGFADAAGFDKPILHGLCTFGFTGRALLHEVCDSDPDRVASMSVRFSSPVMPGEQLDVHIWKGDGEATFRTTATGGRTVIDNGRLELR